MAHSGPSADRPGGPVIGITAAAEQASWGGGTWNAQATVLAQRYIDSVAEAGGIPLMLPPVPGIEDTAGRLDGLVLSGGGDIDPARYGAQPAPQTARVPLARDAAEFALLGAAISLQVPVLGICRGMQVINVAMGGSLHQHLPAVVGHDGHAPVPGGFGAHEVCVAAGSQLAAALDRPAGPAGGLGGGLRPAVPTHHHQAVDRLGKGLTAVAWTADGMVEAFEPDRDDGQFLLGVQWHPEAGDDTTVLRALIAAAAARSAGPG